MTKNKYYNPLNNNTCAPLSRHVTVPQYHGTLRVCFTVPQYPGTLRLLSATSARYTVPMSRHVTKGQCQLFRHVTNPWCLNMRTPEPIHLSVHTRGSTRGNASLLQRKGYDSVYKNKSLGTGFFGLRPRHITLAGDLLHLLGGKPQEPDSCLGPGTKERLTSLRVSLFRET